MLLGKFCCCSLRLVCAMSHFLQWLTFALFYKEVWQDSIGLSKSIFYFQENRGRAESSPSSAFMNCPLLFSSSYVWVPYFGLLHRANTLTCLCCRCHVLESGAFCFLQCLLGKYLLLIKWPWI